MAVVKQFQFFGRTRPGPPGTITPEQIALLAATTEQANQAESAAEAADASEAAALASQTAAATSATASASSATASAGSATAAAGSATAASGSATTAATHATNSQTSANASAASAVDAEASETAAEAAVVDAEAARDAAQGHAVDAGLAAGLRFEPDKATGHGNATDGQIFTNIPAADPNTFIENWLRVDGTVGNSVFKGALPSKVAFDAESAARIALDAEHDYRIKPAEGIRGFSAGRFGKDAKPAASVILDINHRPAEYRSPVGTRYRVTSRGNEKRRDVPERGFSAGRMDKGQDSIAVTSIVDENGRMIFATGRGTFLGAPIFLPSSQGTVRVDTFRDPKPFTAVGVTFEAPAVRLRRGTGFVETERATVGLTNSTLVTGISEGKTFQLGIPSVLAYQWITDGTVVVVKGVDTLVEDFHYRVQYEEGYIVPLHSFALGSVTITYDARKMRVDAVCWNWTTRAYTVSQGTEARRGANMLPPSIPGGTVEVFRVHKRGIETEITPVFPYSSRINYLRPQEFTDYLREMREWASEHRSIIDYWARNGAWGRFGSDGDSVDSMQGTGFTVDAADAALSLNRTPNYGRNRRAYLGGLDNPDTSFLFVQSPDNVADFTGSVASSDSPPVVISRGITTFDPGDGFGAATGTYDYLREGRAWQVLKFLLRTYRGLPTPTLPQSSIAAGSWNDIYRNWSIGATNATNSKNAGGTWNQTYTGSTTTVRVRATGNVSTATGLTNGTVIDGVTVATGDRVFLGSQTTISQNGIYTVVASGAASRWTGADSNAELAFIAFTVEEGDVGAGETWNLPLSAADLGSSPPPPLIFVPGNPNKLDYVNADGLDILMVNGGTNDLNRTDTYTNWLNKGISHLEANIAVMFGLPPRPHANYFFGDDLWRATCAAIEQAARELKIPFVNTPLMFEANKLGMIPLSKHELGEVDSQVHCGLQELNAYADVYCKILAR